MSMYYYKNAEQNHNIKTRNKLFENNSKDQHDSNK
jgi:hypothetical protein